MSLDNFSSPVESGQVDTSQLQQMDVTDSGVTEQPAIAAAAAAASSVFVSAGGIAFNLLFDAAAMAAPAAFRAGIEQAATLLSQAISGKITVNISIDCSGTGGGASAAPASGLYESYSTVRTDLISGAAPGDTTFNALPNTASIQGQSQVGVWNPELKLFGLLGANDTTTNDGLANFTTDISPNDLVGVALHELTHALGRVPYGPAPDIFDLFRFTSAGTRLFSKSIPSTAAYFSVDNGTTKIADYGQKSDPSDFLNSGVQGSNDPFNEYYSASTSQYLSRADLEQLDALGFRVVTSSNLTIGLKNDTGASSSDKLTSDPTLTGLAMPGKTVTLSDNGAPVGSAIANAAGVWAVTPSLADGQHTITASEVDSVGQTVTAAQSFWLATKAPTMNASESVVGQTSQTSDTVTVSAAAESVGANAISGVEIFDGAADLGAAALSGGLWTLTAQKLLPDAHNFTAKATDLAGNVASFALPQVVVGSTAPAVQTMVHPNDLSYSSTASGANHFIDLLNFEASYRDLAAAFGTNQSAMQGWYSQREPVEGRVETFNGLDYAASYPDLAAAFRGAGSSKAVQDDGAAHFITFGGNEGRTTTFNGLDYIASYGDLAKAFGANADAGAMHFITSGLNEGRTTTFDGLNYIASYGDLTKAFEANEQAGANHFITFGANEGRTTTFDGLDYIARYTDLMTTFGANNDAGATHFINFGFKEGRSASPFDVAAYESAHPDLAGHFATHDAFLTAYIDTYTATGKPLT